jgi:hypothetical protein
MERFTQIISKKGKIYLVRTLIRYNGITYFNMYYSYKVIKDSRVIFERSEPCEQFSKPNNARKLARVKYLQAIK